MADTTVADFIEQAGGDSVKVVSADSARLRELLLGPDVTVTGEAGSETLSVSGLTAREIGQAAADAGIAVFELTPQAVSLEEAFMSLTGDTVEYRSNAGGAAQSGAPEGSVAA
jgi:ABC-2 type transport system ATP-binding protein